MTKSRAPFIGALLILALCLFFTAHQVFEYLRAESPLFGGGKGYGSSSLVSKELIADAIKDSAINYRFPSQVELNADTGILSALKPSPPVKVKAKNVAKTLVSAQVPLPAAPVAISATGEGNEKFDLEYSIDPDLQRNMEGLFEAYRPDHGAFVAMDARTGRILSMVSYSYLGLKENLALRASFPSASVFKVVTAAAAIREGKVSAETIIPFNGRNHTLYRSQVLTSTITRWTHFMTLREAFAKSVNTVFGKIGTHLVGPGNLRQYAMLFGFNRTISADLPVEEGRAYIPDDPWGLAESASGFTRENTMSPLQGAMIASSVANEGVMMEPFIVQAMYAQDGSIAYSARPEVSAIPMDFETASELKTLMKETVLRGTSRSSFRGFFKKGLADLDVGGKTGSLTGTDPHGKVDWFVGYADSGPVRIAVAALTIHEKQWRVKSSYLARRAIEFYFKETLDSKNVAVR